MYDSDGCWSRTSGSGNIYRCIGRIPPPTHKCTHLTAHVTLLKLQGAISKSEETQGLFGGLFLDAAKRQGIILTQRVGLGCARL
jgi:hypothetical protein